MRPLDGFDTVKRKTSSHLRREPRLGNRLFSPMLFTLSWLTMGVISASGATPVAASIPTAARGVALGNELFSNGPIHHIRIEIAPKDIVKLRQSSHEYVPAVVRDEKEWREQVGIHLKGSTGSFRPIDGKPGLTLNFEKFVQGQRFYGLRKIHLNNSVEDPSYMNELLGGELFRAAGVPAPRVTHAVVELNGRKLGLYLLKEGFTEDFLSLYFHRTDGKLYEPAAGHDAGEPLKAVSGDGPDDQADLARLAAAAHEPDFHQRWQRLGQILDLETFISFMAMEVMAGHRDGYCLARNNFRIYHDLDTDRMLFFPHGMDQLFGRADAAMQPQMSGLIARAVIETPQGRQQYRQRFAFLLTNVFDVPALPRRADVVASQLRQVLSKKEGRALDNEVATVKERMVMRRRDLEKQLNEPELQLLTFENGSARLETRWEAVDEPAKGKMDRAKTPDGKMALRIQAGPVTSATWRTKVLLGKGRYRFEGAVCTVAVEPLSFGRGKGAALRLIGIPGGQAESLVGNRDWRALQVEFKVEAQQAVVLACELRARAGEAWFDLDSLRLQRLSESP